MSLKVNNFFNNTYFEWKNYTNVTTDGAAALTEVKRILGQGYKESTMRGIHSLHHAGKQQGSWS